MRKRTSGEMTDVTTPGAMRERGTMAAEVEGSVQREQPVTRTLVSAGLAPAPLTRRPHELMRRMFDLDVLACSCWLR
jgi:hypothetical protein